jgi:D-methionine transport system ATP-binding protein
MLQIKNVSKTFIGRSEELHALKNVNLHIKKAQIFGIIGLSGAGKSTLLRSIAGLEKVDEGEVIIDGKNINDYTGDDKRKFYQNIGVVFQGYNLLMQKNVFDNIAFPLHIQGLDKIQISKRVYELLELVGLVEKVHEYPSKLSGGQKQRVAIARALASNPKLLLLDEVTSALDPITTKQILKLLQDINLQSSVTIILITHEMGVVSHICDEVAVLNYGQIEEVGKTKEVLNNPQSEVTRMLLGKDSHV